MAKKERQKGRIKAFLKSRKAKKGSIAVVIVAAAIAVVILLNIVAGLLVERFPNLKLDMTASGSYQLQNDTKDYLSQLDKDITLNVLVKENTFKGGMNAYTGAQYFVQANELLKKMAAESGNITLKYIDLTTNPTFTAKYKDIDWTSNTANNLILVTSGDDYTALTLDDCFEYDKSSAYIQYGYYEYTATKIEQAVVTGILDVTAKEKIGIDIITGSGENEEAFEALKTLLEKNAYKVNTVNLLTEDLNSDSKVAVLYAPTVDLSEKSAEKLNNWLDNNGDYGKNLIYIPINEQTDTPNINEIVKNYGMKISDGIGFCMSQSYVISDQYTFVTDYNNDTYTTSLKNAKIPVAVRDSRDIEILDESVAKPLLSVSDTAGVVPFDADDSKTYQDYLKKDGINVAAIGTKTNEDGTANTVAVFGSPVMFLSTYLDTNSFNNANYIVNYCNTVTNRGDLCITIVSAKADAGELGTITAGTTVTAGIIFIGAVPLVVLIIGLIVFIRRRTR